MRLHLIMKVAMGLCLLICEPAYTQDKETAIDKILNFPSSFYNEEQYQQLIKAIIFDH